MIMRRHSKDVKEDEKETNEKVGTGFQSGAIRPQDDPVWVSITKPLSRLKYHLERLN